MTTSNRNKSPIADVLVIFGITGDLAKKMTFRALYKLESRGLLECPIVGVAINDWGDEELRDHARESVSSSVQHVDAAVLDKLTARLSYVAGDYGDAATYKRVATAIKGCRQPAFYLEIPPSLFGLVVRGLGAAGITKGARVVIEKPFGHDTDSARALQAELIEVLTEDQIYRIDHYLGKEPVMDISYLRFANTMLEPIWKRNYVAHVQMTLAENFGVEDRGHFYDPIGTLRDVIQNHALQMLALVTMEPPTGNHPDSVRDKKLELFRAMKSADPKRYVRGQYDGYLEIDGVAKNSKTETFVALRLEIDNWRWAGVPIYIRAGKNMPIKQTQVTIVFKRPPRLGLGGGKQPEPDQLAIRIDPHAGALIRFQTKAPGKDSLQPSDLEVLFEKVPGEDPEPYERLLADAMAGRSDLFTREDAVNETWRIVQPLLDHPGPVLGYEPGTWGPDKAKNLTRGVAHWYDLWLP